MNKRPKPELEGRCVTGGTDGAAFHRRKPTETGAHPLPDPPLVDTSVSQLPGPGPDSHVSSHNQGLSSMGHPPRRRSGMEGVVEDGLGAWRYGERRVPVGNANKGPGSRGLSQQQDVIFTRFDAIQVVWENKYLDVYIWLTKC